MSFRLVNNYKGTYPNRSLNIFVDCQNDVLCSYYAYQVYLLVVRLSYYVRILGLYDQF